MIADPTCRYLADSIDAEHINTNMSVGFSIHMMVVLIC